VSAFSAAFVRLHDLAHLALLAGEGVEAAVDDGPVRAAGQLLSMCPWMRRLRGGMERAHRHSFHISFHDEQ